MALGQFYLSQAGLNLLTRAQTGAALTITRAQVGEGTWAPEVNYGNITALAKPVANMTLAKMEMSRGSAKITIQFTNKGVGRAFQWTEFALFAQDPDNPAGEILYGSSRAETAAEAVPIPMELTEFNFNVLLRVDGATNVTVVIDESMVYLTGEALKKTEETLRKEIEAVKIRVEQEIGQQIQQMQGTINGMVIPMLQDIRTLEQRGETLSKTVEDTQTRVTDQAAEIDALGRGLEDAGGQATAAAATAGTWDGVLAGLTDNPALVAFDTLAGFALSGGVWNERRQRLEV